MKLVKDERKTKMCRFMFISWWLIFSKYIYLHSFIISYFLYLFIIKLWLFFINIITFILFFIFYLLQNINFFSLWFRCYKLLGYCWKLYVKRSYVQQFSWKVDKHNHTACDRYLWCYRFLPHTATRSHKNQ